MRIGIVGGGQLGRMFIQNALNYGHEIVTLDPDPEAPCSLISHEFICADRNDEEAVYQMGKTCDVVTIEIENVSVSALKRLEAEGVKVFPQPRILEMVKGQRRPKAFLRRTRTTHGSFCLGREQRSNSTAPRSIARHAEDAGRRIRWERRDPDQNRSGHSFRV